jgi:hypothetical protein
MAAVAAAVSTVKVASSARRRPPASATAPSTGESRPMASPTRACIQPHITCPLTGSGAMPLVK